MRRDGPPRGRGIDETRSLLGALRVSRDVGDEPPKARDVRASCERLSNSTLDSQSDGDAYVATHLTDLAKLSSPPGEGTARLLSTALHQDRNGDTS